MEFLACFNFNIIYIKGKTNLVADALSRYYENDTCDELYDASQYVSTDAQLDPEGENLPWDQYKELQVMQNIENIYMLCTCPQRHWCTPWCANEPNTLTSKCPIIKGVEAWNQESMTLEMHKEPKSMPWGVSSTKDDNPTVLESLGSYPNLHSQVEGDQSILRDIKDAYAKDSVLAKVLNKEGHHKNFNIVKGLIYTCSWEGIQVLCIPAVIHNKWWITEIIIT